MGVLRNNFAELDIKSALQWNRRVRIAYSTFKVKGTIHNHVYELSWRSLFKTNYSKRLTNKLKILECVYHVSMGGHL